MDPLYGQHYRALHERHWWWRSREALILETLERWMPAHGSRAILDVGCGDGLFFDRLAAFGEVEGIEPDASLITPEGRARGRIHVAAFDARFAPQRSYGLILMLDVLEHLDDPDAALAHAVQLLDPGGVLLITVPAFPGLWTRHDALNHHRTRFVKGTLLPSMRRAGLRIEDARYAFHWLCAAKVATRLAEAVTARRPSVPRIPPRPVNGALLAVTRAEQRLLTRWRLPFGSSLLVVARAPAGVASDAAVYPRVRDAAVPNLVPG